MQLYTKAPKWMMAAVKRREVGDLAGRILLSVTDYTLGFNEDFRQMTARQIADDIGSHPNHVRPALRSLIEGGYLVENEKGIGLGSEDTISQATRNVADEQRETLQTTRNVATRDVVQSNAKRCSTATRGVARTGPKASNDAGFQKPKKNSKENLKENPLAPKGEDEGESVPDEVPFSEPLSDEPDDLPDFSEDTSPAWKKDPAFVAWWKAYPGPRKSGAPKAFDLWRKNKLSPKAAVVMARLAEDAASDQWTKDDGQYIPGPVRWLGLRRWEDDPAQAEVPGSNLLQFPRKEGEPEWLHKWMRGKGTMRDLDWGPLMVNQFARSLDLHYPEAEVMAMVESHGLVATFTHYRAILLDAVARKEAARG